MAALLKSVESKDFVGSNPTLSASPGDGGAPGLCAACRHSRLITTARGSVFRLCERSATDPAYPRYPPLPVLRCPGSSRSSQRRADGARSAPRGSWVRDGTSGIWWTGPSDRTVTAGPPSGGLTHNMFGTGRRVPRPVLLILVYGIFLVIVGLTAVTQTAVVSADFSATASIRRSAPTRPLSACSSRATCRPDDLGPAGPTAERQAALEGGLARLVKPGQILRVEVRLPDGRVLAADDPTARGTQAAIHRGFRDRAGGRVGDGRHR